MYTFQVLGYFSFMLLNFYSLTFQREILLLLLHYIYLAAMIVNDLFHIKCITYL